MTTPANPPDLDYSRYDDAVRLVNEGNAIIEISCRQCQGMDASIVGHHAYCSNCKGAAYVQVKAYVNWRLERLADYWQARALIAKRKS